jgi:hypothetical protein
VITYLNDLAVSIEKVSSWVTCYQILQDRQTTPVSIAGRDIRIDSCNEICSRPGCRSSQVAEAVQVVDNASHTHRIGHCRSPRARTPAATRSQRMIMTRARDLTPVIMRQP